MNLLKKILVGGAITASAFLPMKGLAQEKENSVQEKENHAFYYGYGGASIIRMNNAALDEIFGAIFGMKGGFGINSGGLSRLELEAELFSKKDDSGDMELSGFNGGAYYDLVLNPIKSVFFYGGAGLKASSLILQAGSGVGMEQAKTSGIGYAARVGIEGQIGGKSTIYLEFFYNDVSGSLEGESTNLSGSGATAGFRIGF